jgi:hypothetical protein
MLAGREEEKADMLPLLISDVAADAPSAESEVGEEEVRHRGDRDISGVAVCCCEAKHRSSESASAAARAEGSSAAGPKMEGSAGGLRAECKEEQVPPATLLCPAREEVARLQSLLLFLSLLRASSSPLRFLSAPEELAPANIGMG